MRAFWTGSISFGLVNIPIRLFSAVQSSTLDLDMLDAKDHSRIRFKRVNENTGEEVQNEQIVKGYLYNENYVILDKEDFESADAEKTKTIDLISFVMQKDIDTIFYEQPYYLEPDKSGVKAYGILRDALRISGKVGVASFVLRNKAALAILKPHDSVLLLNRLRFAEEIRDYSELTVPPIQKTKTKELELANKLIEQLSEDFDIKQYKDTYTEKLLGIIEAKASGKKPAVKKMQKVFSKSDDLMSVLKASLEGKKKAS